MQACKYCNKEKPLVKSHIIPRSFFEIKEFNKKAPKKSLSLLSDAEDLKPMKRPIGIYDVQLFCQECENKFMKYDDYAFKLLNEKKDIRKTQKDEMGQVVGQYYDNFNYEMLKLFFISVLLRAGLSDDFFFQHVNLGPFTDILKEAIDSEDAKGPDDFAVFLAYYAQIKRGPIFFPPAIKRIDGINFYFFHIGRAIFYIKVDKRETPSTFKPIILKPEGKLFLLEFDLRDSNAFEILKRTVDNPANSKYFGT